MTTAGDSTPSASPQAPGPSYRKALERFDSDEGAAKYAGRLVGSRHDLREKRCILAALRGVPAGSRLLDLPCGTGRLTALLVAEGFDVTGADSSEHMVSHARRLWEEACAEDAERRSRARFLVEDVMRTSFEDWEFDAVVSNRLFHHFDEQATRIAALRELRRICRGPLVVSFFNSFALDALRFRIRNFLTRSRPTDRVPIPLRRLRAEAESAGLRIDGSYATRWGISPQWYLRFHSEGS